MQKNIKYFLKIYMTCARLWNNKVILFSCVNINSLYFLICSFGECITVYSHQDFGSLNWKFILNIRFEYMKDIKGYTTVKLYPPTS